MEACRQRQFPKLKAALPQLPAAPQPPKVSTDCVPVAALLLGLLNQLQAPQCGKAVQKT